MRVPGAGICGPSTVGLGLWSRGNVTTGSAGCRALRGHDIYPSYGAGCKAILSADAAGTILDRSCFPLFPHWESYP
jgi:hypothetical protein